MKKLALRVILLTFLICKNSLFAQQPIKIGVIADTHYMHPSLIIKEGEAFEAYLRKDRKLLYESDLILRETVDTLMKENIDLLLIPGDLTKDGEKISHEGVVEILKPLREKGVTILVVPGNHDINNPDAVAFNGELAQQVETVSPEEFRTIYNNFGYNTAIDFDTTSLSYVSEPVKDLRVLCLDVCKYDENKFVSRGDNKNECVTGGYLRASTLIWAKKAIIEANSQGKQIVAMMHHNIVEHFEFQHLFAAPYLIDNYKEVQREFLNLGLHIVFTGHFHSSDIARVGDKKGNQLFDIETGSIVTFPCPYRIILMHNNTLSIETKSIDNIKMTFPESPDFKTYARKQIEQGFDEITTALIHDYHHEIIQIFPKWSRLFFKMPSPEELSEMFSIYLSSSAIKTVLAHYSGNENLRENATYYEAKLMNDLNAFISNFSRQTGGVFSPLLERIIQRNEYIQKFKIATKSIWANATVSKSTNQITELELPVDDLFAVISLSHMNKHNLVIANQEETIATIAEIKNQREKYISFFR